MVKVMITMGTDFNVQDAQLMTPLHRAVMGGRQYYPSIDTTFDP